MVRLGGGEAGGEVGGGPDARSSVPPELPLQSDTGETLQLEHLVPLQVMLPSLVL